MNSRSKPDIPRLLEELEQSDLSVAAFARDRGVPAHRLYWARRRARKAKETIGASDFAEINVAAPAAPTPDSSLTIELRLPNGCAVTLRRDFDPITLRQLLDVTARC